MHENMRSGYSATFGRNINSENLHTDTLPDITIHTLHTHTDICQV